MTIYIANPCHVFGVKRAVGEAVEVAPELGLRLVSAGYASTRAVEAAVAPARTETGDGRRTRKSGRKGPGFPETAGSGA